MKHLLLTFDYELFLGRRSGSVERCLLRPTEDLVAILGEHALRGVFFVDALHLVRLAEVAPAHGGAAADLEAVRAQVRRLAERGHDVFLHLHPHWLDARFVPAENAWTFPDLARYRLESVAADERPALFARALDALREALGPQAKRAALDGFRAGGWSIQPFDAFAESFRSHGIRHDFSVVPGSVARTSPQRYDFRDAPVLPAYRFSTSPVVPDARGDLVELPISTVAVPAWRRGVERQLLRVAWRTGSARSIGDGVGVEAATEPGPTDGQDAGGQAASADTLTALRVATYLDALESREGLQLISHPKMQSRVSLRSLATFLRRARARHRLGSDFRALVA